MSKQHERPTFDITRSPDMFLKVTMVTFFSPEEQKLLKSQRRASKILGTATMSITVILSLGFFVLLALGRISPLHATAHCWFAGALLVGLVSGLVASVCSSKEWRSFEKWAMRYDAHIISQLMAGTRKPEHIPGFFVMRDQLQKRLNQKRQTK